MMDVTSSRKRIFERNDAQPVVLYGREGKSDNSVPITIVTKNDGNKLLVSDGDLLIALRRLVDAALAPPNMDMATYRSRVTAILEAGTAAIGNITTVTTVTALGSVGRTNLFQSQDMVLGPNLTAWALCCRERIS
jgi:hypothetical protein